MMNMNAIMKLGHLLNSHRYPDKISFHFFVTCDMSVFFNTGVICLVVLFI